MKSILLEWSKTNLLWKIKMKRIHHQETYTWENKTGFYRFYFSLREYANMLENYSVVYSSRKLQMYRRCKIPEQNNNS